MSPKKIIASQHCRWRVFADTRRLEQAIANQIVNTAQSSITQRGVFHLVLTGGNTARPIYQLLREIDTDWLGWEIWFGDERCLLPDDAERNSHMAMEAWLNHVAIPLHRIHPIPTEMGLKAATGAYAQALNAVPLFDLVLLGLGEDGHVASLFPNGNWQAMHDLPAVLAITDSPKPPPQRVSLSPMRLSAAHQVLFLVTGTRKREAVRRWQAGDEIPARYISPSTGVDVYVDTAAYSKVCKP